MAWNYNDTGFLYTVWGTIKEPLMQFIQDMFIFTFIKIVLPFILSQHRGLIYW